MLPKLVKTNSEGYLKDTKSGIVVSDLSEYDKYKQQKMLVKKEKNMSAQIDQINSDLSEVKNILRELMSKLDG